MNYSTTYAGVIVIILGWVGLAHITTGSEVGVLIDNLLQIAGIITTIYGRYKAGGVNLLGFKRQ